MRFLEMVYYKLKLMFRDKLFFATMILVPLFITLATGYALRHEKYDAIPVVFVDMDSSDYSRLLIQRVSQDEGLDVSTADAAAAGKMMRDAAAEAILTIKPGFMENIRSGDVEGIIEYEANPSSFSIGYIREVTAGETMRFIANHIAARMVDEEYRNLGEAAGDDLMDEVAAFADSLWGPDPIMKVEYMELEGGSAVASDRVSVPAATAASTGLIAVFVMFYMLFSSGWLVDERTNGTLKRLIAGPGALYGSFTGSIAALAVSGLLQILVFGIVINLAFGVRIFPGALSYLVFMLYILSVISISMFLSSILRTSSQLQAAAPVIALITGFAGGCFWNFVEMPRGISSVALFTPQGWVMKAVNALILNSADTAALIVPSAVLATITLILMPLSYIIIKVQVTK